MRPCMKRPYNSGLVAVHFPKRARKVSLFVLLIVVSIAAVSCRKAAPVNDVRGPSRPVAEAIAEAEQAYAGREDLVKVRQGLVALRQAGAEEQANYDLSWRVAKFNYYLGAHSPDSSEQDKAFHEGIEAGRLAVRLQDGKPEGHFWLGANYGGRARISVLAGLSDFEDIKREMETVIRLDEGHQTGSAYLGLGQLYLQAPGLLGGDTQKAIQYLEKGLRWGPDNALLRAELVAAYLEAHRNEDARKQIDALLAMKPATGYEPEYKEAVAKVRKLQEKIK